MKLRSKAAKSSSPVAVITGGSEGIGAACVRRFLEEGWQVSTVSLHGAGTEPVRGRVLRLCGDLASETVRQELIGRTLETYGRIDLLVNNAGVGLYAPVTTTDIELLRRIFEVNFVAVLRLTQLVIPQMRRQGYGTIVNLGSVAGEVALPWTAGYSASKYAVHAMSDALRRELRGEDIRVIKVCPGIVDTNFRANVLQGEPPPRVLSLRGVVSADEVARAVLRAVRSGSSKTIYIPRIGRVFTAMQHITPWLMDWYLRRFYATPLQPETVRPALGLRRELERSKNV